MTPEVRKREWPRWGVSPTGQRAIFDCIGNLPPEWCLEVPLTSEADDVEEEPTNDPTLASLRALYQDMFGKKPGPKWNAVTLTEKLAEGPQ